MWRRAACAAALPCTLLFAGCGGGAGSAPPSTVAALPVTAPLPAPGATLPPGYTTPQGAVTTLVPTASGAFASAIVGTSNDGTLVVQSTETPAEPGGANASLPMYAVSASEAGGITASAARRAPVTLSRVSDAAPPPFRPGRDVLVPRFRGRSPFRLAAGAPPPVRRTASLQAGTQRTFHIIKGTITGVGGSCAAPAIAVGSACYVDVATQLVAVSQHAYVWVDTAVIANASYGLAQGDFAAAASIFDADFARETAAFGPAFLGANIDFEQCDASKNPATQPQPVPDLTGADPHISIVVTNALESTGEGGYFDFANLLNDQELNCAESPHVPSNGLPMFVVGADGYNTSTLGFVYDAAFWNATDMPRSLAHEFQHYLHALNKVLAPELAGRPGLFDDAFVDEGASMLAEDLVDANDGQNVDTQLAEFAYLYNPSNYALTAFVGWAANPLDTSKTPTYGFYRNTEGNYGAAYLFMRYLYDRFGGAAMLHRLYADTTAAAQTSANTHPILAAAGDGESFAQLYAEFAAALAVRGVATTASPYAFSRQVMLVGTKSLALPGPRTWNLVLNGPRSPDDLTSTQPYTSARIKLDVGVSASALLLQGATDFFNVAPASGAGAMVSGSAPAAAGRLGAALVQGAYDDNPSCLGPSGQCS